MTDDTTTTGKKARKSRNGDSPDVQPRMTGDLLTSSLLAFLKRWNAYGYQLVQELSKAGLPGFDSTTVYRTLRQLERDGLVSSFWDTSESGPARRRYALTNAGESFLDVWVDIFGKYQKILQSAWTLTDNSDTSADAAATEDSDKPRTRRNTNARTER